MDGVQKYLLVRGELIEESMLVNRRREAGLDQEDQQFDDVGRRERHCASSSSTDCGKEGFTRRDSLLNKFGEDAVIDADTDTGRRTQEELEDAWRCERKEKSSSRGCILTEEGTLLPHLGKSTSKLEGTSLTWRGAPSENVPFRKYQNTQ